MHTTKKYWKKRKIKAVKAVRMARTIDGIALITWKRSGNSNFSGFDLKLFATEFRFSNEIIKENLQVKPL